MVDVRVSQGAVPELDDRRMVAVTTVAIAAPVVAAVLFHVAFVLLDRAQPQGAAAAWALAAVVAAWIVAMGLLRVCSGRRGWGPVIGGAVAGAVASIPLAVTVQGSYAAEGALRPPYPGVVVASVVVSALVGVGVLVFMWRMSGQRPVGGVAALGSAVVATYGFAGLWLLVTMGDQVARAGGAVVPGL